MILGWSKESTAIRVFLNITKALELLILFFFQLLSRLFSSLFWFDQEYEEDECVEEEEETRFGYYKNNSVKQQKRHLVADIDVDDGQCLRFQSQTTTLIHLSHHTSKLDAEYQNREDEEPDPDLYCRNKCSSPITIELSKKQDSSPKLLIQTSQEQNKAMMREMKVSRDDKLESTYVAQMCLAWEILSWDYNYFCCKQTLRVQQGIASDPGFPAQVAQQLQQFQVLLQRYIENEPYEYGQRPEIFHRIKNKVAPKLLIVPQIQDYEESEKKERRSRISSASFLKILENSIGTFMKFVKTDKERGLITSVFRRRRVGSVDPGLVILMKKTNRMKLKVKKLQRAGKCVRKKKATKEEEMEMVMGLIDLRVVARVLRMHQLTRQQLTWCEQKMTKLTLTKMGHFHRDSDPLFFPINSSTHKECFSNEC